ncbi:hypothetical protein FB645_005963 [Coemansia sp. IMI 203386]|nr:hypothetical protein FB645_005963 [Coemansia sp. IMI 203386]
MQPVEKLRAAAVRVTYGSSPRTKAAKQSLRESANSVPFPIAANTTIEQVANTTGAKGQSLTMKRRRVADIETCIVGGDSSSSSSDSEEQAGPAKRHLVQMSLFSKRPALADGRSETKSSLLDQLSSKKKQNIHSGSSSSNSARACQQSNNKKEQTFLDFGQRPIVPNPCKQCGMTFQRGRKEDEELHSKYHRSWLRKQSRLLVWNVSAEPSNAARSSDVVVLDLQTSTKRELQRGLEIINVVNEYLGAVRLELSDLEKKQRKLFLHISSSANNKVEGCILAEKIAAAHRLVVEDAGQPVARSDLELPAICGISRIWVSPDARRTGVASKLIDAVRMHFIYGCSVPLDAIAFTQPTADGLAFGRRVFGRKDFLVYAED